MWSGHKVGVCSSSEICARRHTTWKWLQTTAHHCLLHPKPGTKKDYGEDSAHTVCWQKPVFWWEVGSVHSDINSLSVFNWNQISSSKLKSNSQNVQQRATDSLFCIGIQSSSTQLNVKSCFCIHCCQEWSSIAWSVLPQKCNDTLWQGRPQWLFFAVYFLPHFSF